MGIFKPPYGVRLNRDHPLARGLVGAWIMNEGSGNKIFDLSGNGSDGTFANDPAWVGGDIELDGGNDYITGTIKELYRTDKTIVTWIKMASINRVNNLFSIGDNPSDGSPQTLFQVNAGNKLASFGTKDGGGFDYLESNETFVADTWYCVAFVNDAANISYKLYIDGNEVTYLAGTTGTYIDFTDTANNFYIGVGFSNSYFAGLIRSMLVYDQALTPAQIAWLHREPYAMFEDYINPAMLYVTGGEELEKSLSDTINLSDGYIASFGLPESDSISLSDEIAKNAGLPEADTISLSDGIAKAPGLSKSDIISLSDNVSRVVAFLRTLNDSISLSDGLVKNFGTTKTDTISLSDDLVSAVISIILKLNDTITLSDEISKVTSFLRSLSDAVTVSDGISKSVALSKADTIDVSDTRSVGYGLNKEDSISLADLIIKAPGLSIADIINLSDEKTLNAGLNKTDTISLSDDISRAAAFLRSLSDIISLSDFMSKGIIRVAVTPDGRIIIIPVESRAMVVESENRTVTISAENRTITIGT